MLAPLEPGRMLREHSGLWEGVLSTVLLTDAIQSILAGQGLQPGPQDIGSA